MGFYRDGKYIYEPMDVGNGVCDQEDFDEHIRERQKKIDENKAGMEELTNGDKTNE